MLHGYGLTVKPEIFNERLHHTLLCTNELEYGTRIRRKTTALKHNYIQFNDHFIKFLVLDIDRPGAVYDWDDLRLPAPHYIVINKENHHCHYIYVLEFPICKTDNARLKPLEYFAKIQHAYTLKLNADRDFAGLLTKNPNSSKWDVIQWEYAPYSLEYLADFVDLPKKIQKREAMGEGRNVYLFNTIRKIAYREVLFYKKHGAKQEHFYQFTLSKLENLNYFQNADSLGFNEIKAIAKSVSTWVWRRFSLTKFSEIQTARNKKSIAVRNQTKQQRQHNLNKENMTSFPIQNHKISIADLAKKYGKSRMTIARDLKEMGVSKPREQYEKDALERRKIAYELRQSGLKWREIGEKLGISTANAQMLAHRYKTALCDSESVLDNTKNKTA